MGSSGSAQLDYVRSAEWAWPVACPVWGRVCGHPPCFSELTGLVAAERVQSDEGFHAHLDAFGIRPVPLYLTELSDLASPLVPQAAYIKDGYAKRREVGVAWLMPGHRVGGSTTDFVVRAWHGRDHAVGPVRGNKPLEPAPGRCAPGRIRTCDTHFRSGIEPYRGVLAVPCGGVLPDQRHAVQGRNRRVTARPTPPWQQRRKVCQRPRSSSMRC